MANQVALIKTFQGVSDYVAKHISNYTVIEATLNQILGQLTGQSGGLAVPLGLAEIFDRRGLIGVGSYGFNEGTLAGPSYNLTVQAGAYYSDGTFYHKADSSSLSVAGNATGTYYLNLDSGGNPLIGASPDSTTSRQFAWNADTHIISAKALYSGVGILFDGDDYADALTSAARNKSFTKLADRLEEIEVLLGKTVQTPASGDNIAINWGLGGHVRVALDRPLTTFSFSGAYDGQRLVLELIQDAQGERGVAFGAEAMPGTDFTFPAPLSLEANKTDFLGFIYNHSAGKYRYTSLARGY